MFGAAGSWTPFWARPETERDRAERNRLGGWGRRHAPRHGARSRPAASAVARVRVLSFALTARGVTDRRSDVRFTRRSGVVCRHRENESGPETGAAGRATGS